METTEAAAALSALAHEGRLSIFRLLVRRGPNGVAAGDIARACAVRPNTLSSNLNILAKAGLIEARRDGRSILYTAQLGQMQHLLSFLLADCCAGAPEICAPLAQSLHTICDCNETKQAMGDAA